MQCSANMYALVLSNTCSLLANYCEWLMQLHFGIHKFHVNMLVVYECSFDLQSELALHALSLHGPEIEKGTLIYCHAGAYGNEE